MTLQFLTQHEQNALHLEDLYSKFGYEKYKVQRFEEYSFYMENQHFLTDKRLLTFSGPSGKLLALKPDVTTSIVKSCRTAPEKNHKIYYNESVFRIPKNGDEFKEIHQLGVEFIGQIDHYQTLELLNLAVKSLQHISPNFKLCFSNTALLLILLNQLGLKTHDKQRILDFLRQKNTHDLNKFLDEKSIDSKGIFTELLELPGNLEEGIPALETLFSSWEFESELKPFLTTLKNISSVVDTKHLYLDFSHIPNTDYYNGLVFTGYLEGLAIPALTGGRYDNLVEKMGLLDSSALGFAVDLSATHNLCHSKKTELELQKYSSQDDPVTLIKTANKLYEEGKNFRFSN